jgi:hypothetical protein
MQKLDFKNIWTEADFEKMGWHDCKLYGIAFNDEKFEMAFDIDYIIEWVRQTNGSSYKFWVSPVTLIFKNVYNLEVNVTSLNFTIQDISRRNPSIPKNAKHINENVEYDWTIELAEGEINFNSVGYTQYSRTPPVLLDEQHINPNERGGISFIMAL